MPGWVISIITYVSISWSMTRTKRMCPVFAYLVLGTLLSRAPYIQCNATLFLWADVVLTAFSIGFLFLCASLFTFYMVWSSRLTWCSFQESFSWMVNWPGLQHDCAFFSWPGRISSMSSNDVSFPSVFYGTIFVIRGKCITWLLCASITLVSGFFKNWKDIIWPINCLTLARRCAHSSGRGRLDNLVSRPIGSCIIVRFFRRALLSSLMS